MPRVLDGVSLSPVGVLPLGCGRVPVALTWMATLCVLDRARAVLRGPWAVLRSRRSVALQGGACFRGGGLAWAETPAVAGGSWNAAASGLRVPSGRRSCEGVAPTPPSVPSGCVHASVLCTAPTVTAGQDPGVLWGLPSSGLQMSWGGLA